MTFFFKSKSIVPLERERDFGAFLFEFKLKIYDIQENKARIK